ncbi:MAG TPA: amidohydrolase family protein, partial [Gammaproteobacteria bacterium]|nr:amidohydrolase family protein [Gammaproteobacteria bacterium]
RGLADGFGHSLLRQARELAIPDIEPRHSYPRFFDVGSGSPYELEVSPLHASYQDGLSRIISSATVMASALSPLRGLASWSASANLARRDFTYETLFNAVEQRYWATPGLLPASIPALEQTLARLIRGGGRVAIGTDAPAVPYGLGVHLELALLAEAGIPNDQILRLATAEGAIALGLERQIGTLEDGKLADFVVLSGDPLARIADSQTIIAVVKGGVWHDRPALAAAP